MFPLTCRLSVTEFSYWYNEVGLIEAHWARAQGWLSQFTSLGTQEWGQLFPWACTTCSLWHSNMHMRATFGRQEDFKRQYWWTHQWISRKRKWGVVLSGKRLTVGLCFCGTSHWRGLCLGLVGTIICVTVIGKEGLCVLLWVYLFLILFVYFPQPEQYK